jgi:hypothetical protein
MTVVPLMIQTRIRGLTVASQDLALLLAFQHLSLKEHVCAYDLAIMQLLCPLPEVVGGTVARCFPSDSACRTCWPYCLRAMSVKHDSQSEDLDKSVVSAWRCAEKVWTKL